MIWGEKILPFLVDKLLSERFVGRWREQVCSGTSGEVLEIGFAAGPNLSHYPPEVERVYAVEPADAAWEHAGPRIEAFGRPVERIGLDGATIALPDGSVDAVVSTYTMCTIPDLTSALSEIRRVLRPGGSLHFVEHGLSPEPRVARVQRRIQPVWGPLAGGCHVNRDIPELLTEAGFTLESAGSFYAEKVAPAKPWMWLTIGRATPSAD